jgi:putative endonuclease
VFPGCIAPGAIPGPCVRRVTVAQQSWHLLHAQGTLIDLGSLTVYFASDAPSEQPRSDSPRENPRHALGRLGEHLAASHLQRLGFAIVARNVRTRHGEIDLIAFNGEALVFVEVKTRRSHRRWRLTPDEQPLAWLRTRQRTRVRRLASAWLHAESRNRPAAHTIRFDAVGVIVDEADRLLCLDHVESAW